MNGLQTKSIKLIIGVMFLKGKDELMAGCSFAPVLQLWNGKTVKRVAASKPGLLHYSFLYVL